MKPQINIAGAHLFLLSPLSDGELVGDKRAEPNRGPEERGRQRDVLRQRRCAGSPAAAVCSRRPVRELLVPSEVSLVGQVGPTPIQPRSNNKNYRGHEMGNFLNYFANRSRRRENQGWMSIDRVPSRRALPTARGTRRAVSSWGPVASWLSERGSIESVPRKGYPCDAQERPICSRGSVSERTTFFS